MKLHSLPKIKTKSAKRIGKGAGSGRGKTGGRGTPWSIIVTADGAKETINGAEPYDMVKGKIDQLLTE